MAERGGREVDPYPSGSAHPQGKQFAADWKISPFQVGSPVKHGLSNSS